MYKLLIADDEELEREALHLFVAQSGIAVTPAAECASGTELIIKCAEIQPDIIILDINMPGVNGLEALKKIRQADCRALAKAVEILDRGENSSAAVQNNEPLKDAMPQNIRRIMDYLETNYHRQI